MKKMIACLLLAVLAFPAMALADPSFDFEIANSVLYVYSSPVENSDAAVFGGAAPNATNLQGDDPVVFTIVNTSNAAISDGVTFRRNYAEDLLGYP